MDRLNDGKPEDGQASREKSEAYYRKLIEIRDTMNPYARMNGIRTLAIREGYAEVEMPVQDFHCNLIHSLHGGCLYTVADACAGAAAMSYGYKATTMNSAFNYLRPGINKTKIIAQASAVKRGKRVIVLDVKVLDQDGELLCTASFTYAVLKDPIEGLAELEASAQPN